MKKTALHMMISTVCGRFEKFTGQVDFNWDLTWNKSLETGGVLVGDEMTLKIEFEIVKQPEAEMQSA